ncbi:TPA: DNA polymerase III subunit alpha, partial [Streptococcus equi subsp. equi]|nr:DNA polymerase III subunit alpha [Streptococcus equi subsp. equi]
STVAVTPITKLVKDTEATLLVQIDAIRVIRTKSSGQQMAFLSVTDTKQKLDVTLFPEQYAVYKQDLKEGHIYYINGRVKERDNRLQLVCHQLRLAQSQRYWLLVENHQHDAAISDILTAFSGETPVIIHYQEGKETLELNHIRVDVSKDLEEAISPYVLKTVFR